ncbi:MAG: Hsp70 family protein [Parachlamydiaceae bacterium]|nr:Hsp70 family protein [Parachlamydiaceae bacterium]
MSDYIIGIDLGTTNSTLAYAKMDKTEPSIEQFSISQVTSGAQPESLSLPSFLYFPLKEELATIRNKLPWNSTEMHCVGLFARERGAELPSRLISSAKSWLCHSGINRRDKLLPLHAEENTAKMSPLEANAAVLEHLREAWNSQMPLAAFKEQKFLITVPASFDPSARQLVLEAAEKAGYPEIILLEEPQAAFYAWLHAHKDSWRKQLKVNDKVLVIDIGGGTTDFSLISVQDEQGELSLKREAVGSHLLLGGDNIDLALAYLAKSKLEEQGHTIDEWQLQSLVHMCRDAKETLMGSQAPTSVDITIMGRSSRLIGGTLKTTLSKEEAHRLILDGFVPLSQPHERSTVEKRAGLQQIGLPYAQDARISHQLAKFLSMTGETDQAGMEHFVLPNAVLFNGGTLKAEALRKRLMDLLNLWAHALGKPSVHELPGADYDFAVSQGAVNYGLARAGKAIRIKGGTSRSYYIGVEESAPAVPGMPVPLKAVCVVPFGMEEGSELAIDHQEFSLVVGEQATFRFFSHGTQHLSNGALPVAGSVIKNWKQELTELHPIETRLESGAQDGKTIQVKLKTRVTELGVLELWCVAPDDRKWKLEFDLRA